MNKSLLALCLGASLILNTFVFIRFSPSSQQQVAIQHDIKKPINLKLINPVNFNQQPRYKRQKTNKNPKGQGNIKHAKRKDLIELGKKIRQEKFSKSSLKKFLPPEKSTKKLRHSNLLQETSPIKHKSFVSVQNSRNQNLERNKHFSFYQRILEDYINKITANLINQNPKISRELAGEELIGRIIFDVKGNAQALKILKWSRNDEFQEFFLHFLKEIRNIPNPPTELISTNEDFTVTYGLKVIL